MTVLISKLTEFCSMLFSFVLVQMAPIKKKKDQYDARRKQVKENMRKMRVRIRNDPEKYEECKRKERERYEKRKHEGKIKGIKDLTDRDKRKKRKTWRECSRKYREKLRMVENILDVTPPAIPAKLLT